MKVREIMSGVGVTVVETTPIQELTQLLTRQMVAGVPVLDADGLLVGIVTESDIIVRHANIHLPLYLNVLDGFFPFRGEHAFQQEVRHVLATRADELMSDKAVTIDADADVSEAATLMIETHANPLVVTEGRAVIGVISRSDIVRLITLEEQQASGADTQ